MPIGELGQFSPTNFFRRLKYTLDKADGDWVIGALDYSVNFHEGDRYEPHWAVHLHGFTVTDDQEALRRQLVEAVKKSDAIPRPVRVKPWDGDKRAIRYVLKTNFQRRKGIDDAERFDTKTGKSRTCRATKTQRLLAAQKRGAGASSGSYRLGGRLVHAPRTAAQDSKRPGDRSNQQPRKFRFIVGPTVSADRRAEQFDSEVHSHKTFVGPNIRQTHRYFVGPSH